jgi:Fic family protein
MKLPYSPESLPLKEIEYKRLVPLVGEARGALATYSGLLEGLINPGVLLAPLINEEAVISSKIEGTQATQYDLFQYEAGMDQSEEKGRDIQEIRNYRTALIEGEAALKDYPFSLHLVRGLHKTLMNSVRGKDKSPGEFRKDQNWIGRPGCTIEEATYIPPSPLILDDCLRAWETYVQSSDIDPIVQAAITHAQFELIHPFKDGNGRIGRVIITLFLRYKRLLPGPQFYLSRYLERNRDEYYERLSAISERKDWDGWLEFFLTAVRSQSSENISKIRRVRELYEITKGRIIEETHSQYAITVLDAIFRQPIFTASMFVSGQGLEKPTVAQLMRKMKAAGMLVEIREARGQRPAVLCFPELLKITES